MEKEIIITVLAILGAFELAALVICNLWRAHWKADADNMRSMKNMYWNTINANNQRIVDLKEHLKAEKALNQKIHLELENSRMEATALKGKNETLEEHLTMMQETLVDYETLIQCKDEELNERDSAVGSESYATAGIRENTRLIDSLRAVVLRKCKLLNQTWGLLVMALRHDSNLVDKLWQCGVEAPKFEEIEPVRIQIARIREQLSEKKDNAVGSESYATVAGDELTAEEAALAGMRLPEVPVFSPITEPDPEGFRGFDKQPETEIACEVASASDPTAQIMTPADEGSEQEVAVGC